MSSADGSALEGHSPAAAEAIPLDTYLDQLQLRAEFYMRSRTASLRSVGIFAKRELLMLRLHADDEPALASAVRSALMVVAIFLDTENRKLRPAKKKLAMRLALVRPEPKVSNEAIRAEQLRGGTVREKALRLGVNPSTVSRRTTALHQPADATKPLSRSVLQISDTD